MTAEVSPGASFILDARRWGGGIGRFAAETVPFLPPHRRIVSTRRPTHPAAPAELAVRLMRHGRRAGPFFSHGYIPPVLAPMPSIVTIHDLMYLRGHSAYSRRRAAYLSALQPFYRRCSAVVTMSFAARDEVLEWLGGDVHVEAVGGGVAPTFRPASDGSAPDLTSALYVGSRFPNKNVDTLLRGFSRSRQARKLRVTGTTQEWAPHVADSGIGPEVVTALGALSESELVVQYQRAGVFVMPSLEEGYGLPALEAMACGTPVIYGRCQALCEVVGDAGIAVDPHDADAIGQAIDDVLGDTRVRAELVDKGLRRAARCTWEAVAGRIAAVIELVS